MNKILREEMEYLIHCNDKAITPDVKDDVFLTLQYIDELENKIDKAIEYITNGSDFKSIYFKKADEELWKVLLEDNIKNNLLDILRGEDNGVR